MANVISRETKLVSGDEKVESSQTVAYLIYFIFGVLEFLLLFRLIFKLLGANPTSGFVSLIYSITQLFVLPFNGIFPLSTTEGAVTTAILEPSTLVAVVVYAILAWGIIQLVAILSRRQQV